MKKIFTLLFTTALLGTAFAQKDGGDWGNHNDGYASNSNRGYNKYGHGNNDFYYFTPRERDREIGRINHYYDNKLRSVKREFFMNWYQRNRIINNLEAKRSNESREVYIKFKDRRNRFGNWQRDRNDW